MEETLKYVFNKLQNVENSLTTVDRNFKVVGEDLAAAGKLFKAQKGFNAFIFVALAAGGYALYKLYDENKRQGQVIQMLLTPPQCSDSDTGKEDTVETEE